MSEQQWLTFDEAVAIVRDRFAASVGRSESLVREALKSDEVRSKSPLLAADDGLVGAINQRAGARPPAEKGRFSKVDFLDWLDRQTIATAPQRREGVKTASVRIAAKALWGDKGPPAQLPNKLICRDVREKIKQTDNRLDISDKQILRAIGRE